MTCDDLPRNALGGKQGVMLIYGRTSQASGWNDLKAHYKEIVVELTYFCHFGQITINSDIFRQLSVTVDNFISIFCHLSRLNSDMFLSIRPLFPCSGITKCW